MTVTQLTACALTAAWQTSGPTQRVRVAGRGGPAPGPCPDPAVARPAANEARTVPNAASCGYTPDPGFLLNTRENERDVTGGWNAADTTLSADGLV